jgi:hypothetical protein
MGVPFDLRAIDAPHPPVNGGHKEGQRKPVFRPLDNWLNVVVC